ncbi:MAG: protein kinase [Lentisphaeria bacterium]|nr:protein kinase [Lentisphaeria bacterium]
MDDFHGMKVLASCGRGGFGEVCYCEEISGRRVAVKIVSKNTLGGEWQRELQGVRNYSRITDEAPELLKIFHVEEDEECFWYTMEPADSADPEKYVPDTLAGRLAAGPLAPEELFPVLSGIFRGVRAVHEAGFAHRDIKPENVIFVKGKPKLADIGLFSSLSATVTKLAGSFEFIPPEARSGESLDSSDRASRQRNDLYAFGKVIYCAVTGNDPREFPSIPPELNTSPLPVKLFMRLALQLCEKDPSLRIDSVAEAAEELEVIGKILLEGEDLRDRFRFTSKEVRRRTKALLLHSGRWLLKYGWILLICVAAAAAASWFVFKPKPPVDLAKVTHKTVTNKTIGFSMLIPFKWEVLTTKTFEKLKKKMLEDPGAHKHMTAEQLKTVFGNLAENRVMILCDFDPKFIDNLTVQKLSMPGDEFYAFPIDELRTAIKTIYEGELKLKTEIYEAKKVTCAGQKAIFMDLTFLPGTRTHDYRICFKDYTVEITLTAKTSTFEQRKKDLEAALKTLKFL